MIQFKYLFYFGFGQTGISIVNIVVQTWLIYFFAPDSGRELIAASTIGAILMFGRIIDAVSDPLIGNWSDRLQSPNGRRLPFLMYSAIPLAVVMFLIFYEPLYLSSSFSRIIILAILLGSFYFLFTAFAAPYLGMIADLSTQRSDRANLSTSAAIFNLIGTGIALIGVPLLIQHFSKNQKGFQADAYTPVMAILSGVALFSFIVCIIGMYPLRKKGESAVTENTFTAIRDVFKNRSFVIYLFGMNIFWGGFFIINASVPYYITVLMKREIGFQAVALGAAFGAAIVSFPIVNILMKKIGNRALVMISSAWMAVALFFIYFIPNPPFNLSSVTFGIILMTLSGFPIAVLFIAPNAMVAELSDFRLPDGKKVGEAIYFGVQGLFMKFFIGVVSVVVSVLFDVFGKSQAEPLGVLLTGPVVSIFAIIAVILFYFYPDDKKELFNK